MKKILKRGFVLSLAIWLLVLSSCSNEKTNVDVTETTETVTKGDAAEAPVETQGSLYGELLTDLPKHDFGGASFRIATDDISFFAPPGSESYVGKEVYMRNRAVEEKYHVKIVLTEESGSVTIADRIKTEAMAGTSFCDLIVLKSNLFQSLASGRLLQNVRNVPYLQLSTDGMHKDSVAATTLGSFTYGFSGDFICKAENFYAVFFNKTLLEATELPNLYSMVRDNQWDYENFLLYAEEVYSQARANGNKVFGYLSTESREGLINALWAASGQRFLDNEYGERPILKYQNETTDDFISKLQKLLFRSVAYSENTGSAVHEFSSGNSAFLIAPLSAIEEVKSQGLKYGIVPLPKQDINQSHFYSYLKPDYHLAGIANGTPDLALTGMVTTALVKASHGMQLQLESITYLNLHFNSQDDFDMLQRIMATPYYDPVEFFGQMDPSFPAATQTLLYRVVSSDGRFDALYSQYSKMLDKFLNENL